MRIAEFVASIAMALILHAEGTTGTPAMFPDVTGMELWQSTPEVSQPPAGMPASYRPIMARRPQPPSGVHVPAPKDRGGTNEQDGRADFNKDAPFEPTAPGFQVRAASTVQGVISALDPNKQSPLNTGKNIVFNNLSNTAYKPKTNLFDPEKIKLPYDTNRWWLNLVVENGIDPIHPYPYMVKCQQNSSIVGFPKFTAVPTSMTSSQVADWEVGDASGCFTKRLVTGSDALGVEVTWSGSTSATMKSRFYKGQSFVTFQTNGMQPLLKTIHAILKVDQLGRTVNSYGTNEAGQATKLVRQMVETPSLTQVTLNDGSQWLIASKPAITWTQSGTGQLVSQGSDKHTGFIQLAHMGDKPADNLNVLQKYAGTYPIEGSVTYAQIQNNQGIGRSADVLLFYKTNTDDSSVTTKVYERDSAPASMTLLSFVLPHHAALLSKTALLSPGLSGYRSAKGPLTAVAGNIITYRQPLESVSFDGSQPISSADKDSIQQQLLKDVVESTTVTAPDPYFFGKGIARIARLYQIAMEIGDSGSAATLNKKLIALMNPWLVAMNNEDPLRYDVFWGGIVSQKGADDSAADFGQGRYNDHHFHYGYFLYAGAILAKYDVTGFQPFQEPLNQLLRDYANPSYIDTQFPYMRHFDPYDGHSWAAGVYTFGDGRNQESTGEAINAYYSAYLYAKATGLEETADFYEIILNMEATSGKLYWHPTIAEAKQLYMDPFIHNVVGVLWSSKADFATFFGANSEFIYGIQMIPFTPATKLLVTADWVKDAWCPDSSCSGTMKVAADQANNNGWAQFLYTAYSMVDRKAALSKVMSCTPDDGNSLTNVLHWIATNGQQIS
ncbi:hypothetical protein J3B02_001998 [Coemansia erecta]|uniref:glucan endo-1,3-beta-D-glucosidase n=1 Tax=Coemansia asiatica TaxID=1052880 RepID=A0A9W7XJ49_9FUNG|nr:hypothetical protein LPJ64_002710 [Coemansia asiatica]KAJ2855758.1 hypothetical protein J3B02_001998 [Coemansia erecta]KAJ2880053.1 hypothetical protein FB639_002925 [Coemansia asiatica]